VLETGAGRACLNRKTCDRDHSDRMNAAPKISASDRGRVRPTCNRGLIMNVQATTEIRELTAAEVRAVSGGATPSGPGPVPLPYPNVTRSKGAFLDYFGGTDEAAGERE
jgi:hypothetical protein